MRCSTCEGKTDIKSYCQFNGEAPILFSQFKLALNYEANGQYLVAILLQVHYPFENKKEFEDAFPADFIAEGTDQTRFIFWRRDIRPNDTQKNEIN